MLNSEMRSKDFLTRMLRSADPLADQAAAEVEQLGPPAHGTVLKGLHRGLSSVRDEAPPAVQALIAEAEAVPEWLDQSLLLTKAEAYLSVPKEWFAFGLECAFLKTFASPRISRMLAQSGKLINRTSGRLQNTAAWYNSTMVPAGLSRGNDGYVSCVKMRMMHARIRNEALKRGWDVQRWELPINQLDTARTWLENAFVPYRSLTRLGFDFTPGEMQRNYELWKYAAHLMGVDPAFYNSVTTDGDAQDLLALIDTTNGAPDDNSRALASALLDARTAGMPWPRSSLIRASVAAGMRFVIGDQLADALALPDTALKHAVPIVAGINSRARKQLRAAPEAWAQMIDANLKLRVAG